jgi:hypothetical protein
MLLLLDNDVVGFSLESPGLLSALISTYHISNPDTNISREILHRQEAGQCLEDG